MMMLVEINADPLIPSLAIVFLTTSTAELYVPGEAVCNRVFVKSNGCPTRTQDTPPNPPDKKDLIGSTVCFCWDLEVEPLEDS